MSKTPMLSLVFMMQCILISAPDYSKAVKRIKISAIIPTENTGQNYSAWLNDNIDSLIPNCWNSSNFKYVDIELRLESPAVITRLSLYDYEGIFSDNPASLYAINGSKKTLIGEFTGGNYKAFVDIMPDTPMLAESILVHKYSNNIPQKIQIYGFSENNESGDIPITVSAKPVFSVENIGTKSVGDSPFSITVRSTNTEKPVRLSSSDTGILSIHKIGESWTAVIKKEGEIHLHINQEESSRFLAGDSSKSLIILSKGSVIIQEGKIPIDPNRWFQLTNASNGLDQLFDGITDQEIQTGWGKILENYDSYYPVLNGEQIDLKSIRIYDGNGTNNNQPMSISIITKEDQKISLGSFNGNEYNKWVGPDHNFPDSFGLQTIFHDIKYIVINSWNFFPTEIEFYGNYIPEKIKSNIEKKFFPLKQMFGINGFEWNFEAPESPDKIDNKRLAVAKSFTGLRHYMDWEKLEYSEGNYTFNPTFNGGWNYDLLYDSCKAAGITVLACLKTVPSWMLDSYPPSMRDNENVPAKYGKDLSDPPSYIEQARLAFQYAARYGNNKNIDIRLLKVNKKSRWNGDAINVVKTGLNLIKYIECENERDKWWKGRKAYQTAYEYAANLSAFYDGNKNTMGPGVGIKNADSTMNVVMAGTASPSTDYLKGMVDWCRQNRGYNADGSVNLCWDVINYHYYSNDSKSSQGGNATRGAAPELSGTAEKATEFVELAREIANGIPVWVTEIGYDINQGSPFKAIPLGNKSALLTQADWILRSSLLYARSGVERIFFYTMYDDNLNNPLQFSSSGLLNNDLTRRPSADYLLQVRNIFGDYQFTETISTSPMVDKYQLNGINMYAIFLPNENPGSVNYTLDLGQADSAIVYIPSPGKENMDVQRLPADRGKITISASGTPVFVVPVSQNASTITAVQKKRVVAKSEIVNADNHLLEQSIKLYPNPVENILNIKIDNRDAEKIYIRIYESTSGRLIQQSEIKNTESSKNLSLNMKGWITGYYLVEIIQGKNRFATRILKVKP